MLRFSEIIILIKIRKKVIAWLLHSKTIKFLLKRKFKTIQLKNIKITGMVLSKTRNGKTRITGITEFKIGDLIIVRKISPAKFQIDYCSFQYYLFDTFK